jgi:hypothetical protein
MQLWQWTVKHFHEEPASTRRVAYPLAEALCWLLAARAQILDVLELDARVTHSPALTGAFPGYVSFFTNLSHVQAARASGETGRLCAELVYGYNRHPSWDDACATGCCGGEEVDAYDALFPGFAATSRVYLDVVESDGSHAAKAGPCARFPGLQRFQQLRAKLDGCLTGNRLARDLAVEALSALHPGVPDHAA